MRTLPDPFRSFFGSSLLAVALAACGGGSGGPASSAPVSASLSAVAVVSGVVASDGVSAATITVMLRDQDDRPAAQRRLTVAATGSENSFWPSPTATTDGAGRAQVQIASTRAERKLLSVMVDGGPSGPAVLLDDVPELEFVQSSTPRKRVSVSSSGAEANDFSGQAAISGDGRWVGFQSKAFNLVPGDTNQKEDVFVHDLETGATERVSLTPAGGQFHDLCGQPCLSDDGGLVAFQGRDTDDDAIFLRQRASAVTQPISEASGLNGPCFDPALSGDGRWVAFVNNDGESQQVFVYDRLALTLALVSQSSGGAAGDDPSHAPSISRDGRWVAFASTADNLVSGDSNDKDDVFVHDRQTGLTRRVSVSAGGAQGDDDSREASIAADGRWVAFSSKAANLVPGDDNGKQDVFVHDLATGWTERVSVDPAGQEVDKESLDPDIGADGRYVVFTSFSDDLVALDTNGKQDVFRRDLVLGVTIRVSLGLGGSDPNESSSGPALANDAAGVAFTAKADNLVPSDENDKEDVFSAPRD